MQLALSPPTTALPGDEENGGACWMQVEPRLPGRAPLAWALRAAAGIIVTLPALTAASAAAA